jgi:hypothetical protein
MKHLVFSCAHARPGIDNERADWLGDLIMEERPDVVVNLGDLWDMESLCSWDKGTKGAVGRNYQEDINSGIEFNDRLFHKIKKSKKKLPRRVFTYGNHEYRVNKAINESPHLEGDTNGISPKHFQLEDYYDDVVEYDGSTPGSIRIDGINYSHYVVSGAMGRAIGGEHHAHSILAKTHESCTVGHAHILDYAVQFSVLNRGMMACVAGTYQEDRPNYAGNSSSRWWRGCVLKSNVEDGVYDLRTISIQSLKGI